MCSLDLEPCSVWRERVHVARKVRNCNSCGQVIRPGDPYLSHFDVFEGEANHEAACFVCWGVRQQFADAHGQSFAPSMLDDQLWACIDGDGESEWRDSLAIVLRRYRTSPSGRKHLAAKWDHLRERRARIAAATGAQP